VFRVGVRFGSWILDGHAMCGAVDGAGIGFGLHSQMRAVHASATRPPQLYAGYSYTVRYTYIIFSRQNRYSSQGALNFAFHYPHVLIVSRDSTNSPFVYVYTLHSSCFELSTFSDGVRSVIFNEIIKLRICKLVL
jgi:hypothetical protein